jgi:hypothetical protein
LTKWLAPSDKEALMPKKASLTKNKVPAWCLGWQQALGLGDWEIDVNVLPHTEMIARHGDACTMGNCKTNRDHKWAEIDVIDPETDTAPADRLPYDIEYTLLHEHLHVCLDDIDRVFEDVLGMLGTEARTLMRGVYNTANEQLVNKLTRAFKKVKK